MKYIEKGEHTMSRIEIYEGSPGAWTSDKKPLCEFAGTPTEIREWMRGIALTWLLKSTGKVFTICVRNADDGRMWDSREAWSKDHGFPENLFAPV